MVASRTATFRQRSRQRATHFCTSHVCGRTRLGHLVVFDPLVAHARDSSSCPASAAARSTGLRSCALACHLDLVPRQSQPWLVRRIRCYVAHIELPVAVWRAPTRRAQELATSVRQRSRRRSRGTHSGRLARVASVGVTSGDLDSGVGTVV